MHNIMANWKKTGTIKLRLVKGDDADFTVEMLLLTASLINYIKLIQSFINTHLCSKWSKYQEQSHVKSETL